MRSVWMRGLLFAVVLLLAGYYGRPWTLGWIRPDEAQEIANDFLLKQGADLDRYTMIRATEHRRDGSWTDMERNIGAAADPAVGYLLRYFVSGLPDGWTVGVSPAGQIYKVEREQYDDSPGAKLDRRAATSLTVSKLATDLALPMDRLMLTQDSLFARPQRNDWGFVFSVSDSAGHADAFYVGLTGDVLTSFRVLRAERETAVHALPARTAANRVLGFAIILIGVFVIWQFHKSPLANSAAGTWGGVTFLLILLIRGLTFPKYVILMPSDMPYAGFLARVGLSAVVDALQGAILVGLLVATGDSAMRDHILKNTTLTRLGRGIRSWSHAWANAARWALPAAALVILAEIAAMKFIGPVGMYSKIPPMLAGDFASPLRPLALPAQIAYDVFWDEGLYRLWLLPFMLLFFRVWLGVIVAAGFATYWAGFNLSQALEPGTIFFFAWTMIAGFLVARSGILAAVLFHLFVIAGYAIITLVWIGFDATTIGLLIASLAGILAAIAWKEEHTTSPVS